MRLQYGPCFLLIFLAISQAKLLSTQNLVNIFEMIAALKVPEAFLTVPQIIKLHGYPVETHRILTEDGYILTLHRIPGSELSPPRAGKKPVLLQHGILSCSVDWIIVPNGLGYLLADAGYDVWMGNSRGNTYSSSHVELSIEDPEFWQFSWHEMGIYDLPATIDYILEQTMQKKLYYIGHSMGNTMFYVLCSMRPEYNAKIRAQFSLAPVAFVEHIQSKYQMVAFFTLNMNWLYNELSWNNILPRSEMWRDMVLLLCSKASWSQDICANIILSVFGGDKTSIDPTCLRPPLSPLITHSSKKAAAYLLDKEGDRENRECSQGKFRQFNYGFRRNLRIYGQFTPPDYDLEKVTAPITLIYSSGDKLADLQDVEQLIDRLPNVYDTIFIDDPQFQHMDFITNNNLDTIYDEIISSMRTNDAMIDLGFSDTDMAFNFIDLKKIDTDYNDESINENNTSQNQNISSFTDNTSNKSDNISASKYVMTESSPPGNKSDDMGASSSSSNIATSLMSLLTLLLISLSMV
uniref:Partial AB-hydrolase lipase domain-containing protein n=1 Tax=Timema monikensis TaxID=170555 RepID=A0A7R9EC22_9NEOP|nr:unnamed protein product [Timema monikensis]